MEFTYLNMRKKVFLFLNFSYFPSTPSLALFMPPDLAFLATTQFDQETGNLDEQSLLFGSKIEFLRVFFLSSATPYFLHYGLGGILS